LSLSQYADLHFGQILGLSSDLGIQRCPHLRHSYLGSATFALWRTPTHRCYLKVRLIYPQVIPTAMQSESAAEGTQLTRVAQPYHVTVTKNAKGSYQWEVSVYSETADDALASVEHVEKGLRARYGSQDQGGE